LILRRYSKPTTLIEVANQKMMNLMMKRRRSPERHSKALHFKREAMKMKICS